MVTAVCESCTGHGFVIICPVQLVALERLQNQFVSESVGLSHKRVLQVAVFH